MTRAQMKRAAMALGQVNMGYSYSQAAEDWGVEDANGLGSFSGFHDSTLSICGAWIEKYAGLLTGMWREEGNSLQASMLMSEAHRPAGHDGDGKDEL